jgi:ribosomal protein L11 methyltransferase PrmA
LNIWSDVEYVYRCLADGERTLAFREAIRAAVKPGNVVLDLGTGSGIMALFAAEAGAGKVYAAEIGEYLYRAAAQTFAQSEYASRFTLIRQNALDLALSQIEKPDVVLCEMITTGLISEMHGPVLNALKRAAIIDDQTRLIPAGLSTSVSLVSTDFQFYGMRLEFPIFLDYFTRALPRSCEFLSLPKEAQSVQFGRAFSEDIEVEERVIVNRSGRLNGLRLDSATSFPNGASLGTCVSYCQPVILPVAEAEVREGQAVTVHLKYSMGAGFDGLTYRVDV